MRPRARRDGIADAFRRCVDQRDVRLLGHVGDAVVERQAVHDGAAAAERHSAQQRRAGLDHAGDLATRVAAGWPDHRHPPWLGIEERQPQRAGHGLSSEGKMRPTGRGSGPIMRLAEYDGKALLRRHGLAVPPGVLVHASEEPPKEAAGWPGYFLKAQLLEGGRGKSGLVRRLQNLSEFREARRLILATLDDADTPLLLEEAVPIAQEIFAAVRVDGTAQRLELLLAPQ